MTMDRLRYMFIAAAVLDNLLSGMNIHAWFVDYRMGIYIHCSSHIVYYYKETLAQKKYGYSYNVYSRVSYINSKP